MNAVDRKSTISIDITATEDDSSTQELAAVRDDLLAIPTETVRRPYENLAALTAAVLAGVADARPATREEEVRFSRHRAQHEVMCERPRQYVADLAGLRLEDSDAVAS